MEGTYDARHDSVYLYLTTKSPQRVVARTLESKDDRNILYDYDREGKLIGLEFLNASGLLPLALIRSLERR